MMSVPWLRWKKMSGHTQRKTVLSDVSFKLRDIGALQVEEEILRDF